MFTVPPGAGMFTVPPGGRDVYCATRGQGVQQLGYWELNKTGSFEGISYYIQKSTSEYVTIYYILSHQTTPQHIFSRYSIIPPQVSAALYSTSFSRIM